MEAGGERQTEAVALEADFDVRRRCEVPRRGREQMSGDRSQSRRGRSDTDGDVELARMENEVARRSGRGATNRSAAGARSRSSASPSARHRAQPTIESYGGQLVVANLRGIGAYRH